MRNGKYILMCAPNNYPGKRYRGRYIYEHHYVWWKNTGELVPVGHIVHHKNDDKRDNRFINLEVMSNRDHVIMHNADRSRAMLTLVCSLCNLIFLREKRNVMAKIKQGQSRFYCCRSHQVIDQQKRRRQKKLNAG